MGIEYKEESYMDPILVLFTIMLMMVVLWNDQGPRLALAATKVVDGFSRSIHDSVSAVLLLSQQFEDVPFPKGPANNEPHVQLRPEVTIKGVLGKETTTDGKDSYESTAFLHGLLQMILGKITDGRFVIRVYEVVVDHKDAETARKMTNWRIQEVMKAVKSSTLSWAGDTSITVLDIYAGEQKLAWRKVPGVSFFNSSKMAKRLAMFSTSSYLFGSRRVNVTDSAEYVEGTGTISIGFHEVSEENVPYHDGRSFMRKSLFLSILRESEQRLLGSDLPEAGVEEKMNGLDARAFNVRFLTKKGIIKGDAIIVDDEKIPTDLWVPTENVKAEVIHGSDEVFFTMTPQEQWGRPRLNRQTVGLFYEQLFDVTAVKDRDGDHRNIVMDALADRFKRLRDDLVNGRPTSRLKLHALKQDALSSTQAKTVQLYEEAGSVNESVYLTGLSAGGVMNMFTPTRADRQDSRVKDYPAPYAIRMSMRSELDYEVAYGVEAPNGVGEIHLTPFGAILPDTVRIKGNIISRATKLLLETFGGADWDDHMELHFRVATSSSDVFGIKPGDVMVFAVRNPIGVSSDGERVYAEYFVFKATKATVKMVLREFGGKTIKDMPTFSFEGLIPSIIEMPEMKVSSKVQEIMDMETVLPDEYDMSQVRSAANAMFDARGVYGIHSNLMLAFGRLRMPFPFLAPEEWFVDEAQQTRKPKALALIASSNESFGNMLMGSGEVFDKWEARRLGFFDRETQTFLVDTENGVYSKLVQFHQACVGAFQGYAQDHIHRLVEAHKERASVLDGSMTLPFVLKALRQEENQVRRSLSKDDRKDYYLRYQHVTANKVVTRLVEAVKNGMSPDEARTHVANGFLFQVLNLKESQAQWGYSHGDRLMMQGRMFDLVIKAIRHLKDEDEWVSIHDFLDPEDGDDNGEGPPSGGPSPESDSLEFRYLADVRQWAQEFGPFRTSDVTKQFGGKAGEVMDWARKKGLVEFNKPEGSARYVHWF